MKDFANLFADELAFLHDSGDAFATANPKLAKYLSRRSSDPDVERLLEGFAFLSAKLRAKINDDFPELTHSMINLLWPNYLRTVPSFSMLQFTAGDKVISEPSAVAKGAEVRSGQVEGCQTRWQTCWGIDVMPLAIVPQSLDIERSRKASAISFDIEGESGISLDQAIADKLALHFAGDYAVASTLYLYVFRFLAKAEIIFADGSKATIRPDQILRGGLGGHEGILPYPDQAFVGYRLLQEYFHFPEKFLYAHLCDLAKLPAARSNSRATLRFEFEKPLPHDISIRQSHFALNTVPIVNLFPHTADPIRSDGRSHEYAIRPMTGDPSWYEIFSVDLVYGVPDGEVVDDEDDPDPRYVYHAFESFQHELEMQDLDERRYYRHRVEPYLVRPRASGGFRHLVSFTRANTHTDVPTTETVSFNVTATNRELPLQLEVGDICEPSNTSPSFANYQNISKPTRPVPPPVDGNLQWTLISNLSGSYLTLSSVDALRQVLSAYDFRALVDRQSEREGNLRLDGLKSIQSSPFDLMIRGLPTRGVRSHLSVEQANFANEGDMYLFLTVLSEFMTSYASVNSFHQLDVVTTDTNETYRFPAKPGRQSAI